MRTAAWIRAKMRSIVGHVGRLVRSDSVVRAEIAYVRGDCWDVGEMDAWILRQMRGIVERAGSRAERAKCASRGRVFKGRVRPLRRQRAWGDVSI